MSIVDCAKEIAQRHTHLIKMIIIITITVFVLLSRTKWSKTETDIDIQNECVKILTPILLRTKTNNSKKIGDELASGSISTYCIWKDLKSRIFVVRDP